MSDFAAMRQSSGMDSLQLAAELGVDHSIVMAWEAGDAPAPDRVYRTLHLLARFSPLARHDMVADGWQDEAIEGRSGTFIDNMKLPVHRWFRYSAGFSAQWTASVISDRMQQRETRILLDPFAGSGTSLLAAQSLAVDSIGFEPHPFVHRIAETKLDRAVDPAELEGRAAALLSIAKTRVAPSPRYTSALLEKCYRPEAMGRLLALRAALASAASNDRSDELLWLALTAILRECSHAGTAQWQYVLPNKTKSRIIDPFAAFANRVRMFADDIRSTPASRASARIFRSDARDASDAPETFGKVDLIVTSPPYPNNYDYADATRLEMTFWGEVQSWGDLHAKVRKYLMRSCSQHSAADRLDLEELLADPVVGPIAAELSDACRTLAEIRLEKGGKKTYHTMVAAYFCDMARIWSRLRQYASDDADICFVIGDSAPYGVHIPVEKWFATLAEAAGFREPRFEKLRDRNIKWKNRKHRVPLKEGRLWLKG
jgi:hypothetical protein